MEAQPYSQTSAWDHSSNSSASSSARSSTSSEGYDGQESLSTFRDKLGPLCQSIGLKEPRQLQHGRGGAYNRIILVTYTREAQQHHCVLRMPRFVMDAEEAEEIKEQAAIIRFVSRFLSVPTVLAYDATTNNSIGWQYVVQTLVSGSTVSSVYRGLKLDEKLQIAALIVSAMVEIEHVTFQSFGRLVPSGNMPDSCDDFPSLEVGIDVAPLRIEGQEMPVIVPSQGLGVFLATMIDHQIKFLEEESLLPKWLELRRITQEMDQRKLLEGDRAVLWHWDFAARNIMVEKTGAGSWQISGILDWDGALSVPPMLSRKPPAWLWNFGEDPPGWTGDVDTTPHLHLTEDGYAVKQHFDALIEAALPGWCADAYGEGRWARRLAKFAMYGFECSSDWARYRAFVKDWRVWLERSESRA